MNSELSNNASAGLSTPVCSDPGAQASTTLRAGPLTVRFDGGELRYIKLGRREVILRIHATVRDRNWGTVPFELSELQSEIAEDRFLIRYTSTHRQAEIHFVWQARIVGEPDGSIRFTLDGEARSTFLRNRIGFCLLHPIRECAGARCRTEHADGTRDELTFPELVAPEQPVPGFHDLVAVAHEIEPGLWAETSFVGELFEMEDQRNWSEASFKTFCTPLRIPFPVEIKAGTRVTQEIGLKLVDERLEDGDGSQAGTDHSLIVRQRSTINDSPSDSAVSVFVTNERRALLPIGLGVASHGQPLAAKEIELLSRLRLGHLRCDVKLAQSAWPESLRLAWQQAATLGAPLELAVHLPRSGGDRDLTELSAQLQALQAAVIRVLLLRDGEKTLSLASLRFARPHLAFLGVPIGAGTDADFYQLNQFRPPHLEADFIHWTLNPQAHAFDLASLAETPAAIPDQLLSAAVFFSGKPAVVSPVTLKPRFNPVATGPESLVLPDELPAQVDPRQLSPFAAAWTLAALKYLAEGGADSVTLFETTGWRGVMERAAGSPMPAKFPSEAGQLFPLYYVIAGVNRFRGGEVISSRSSDPLRVESMALGRNGVLGLGLANMTGQNQTAVIRGLRGVTHRHHLPWAAADVWRFHPDRAMAETRSEPETPVASDYEVLLEPYGLHWMEAQGSD